MVAPAVVLPLTLSGDTMANPNAPVPVPVQGQPNLSAWASPSQVTLYQTSPALFGLLSTVQGTTTLQYAPGGSPNSASLVDGQGNVQGTLQGGQITLTNPAALTFNPPGSTPAPVAPATPANAGTPSASSLAGVAVRLGDTAAMTVPDAGAIPANPGFTPTPPMPALPGYSTPNLNLPPLTGIPIPDQPAAPISTGSPPVRIDLAPESLTPPDPIQAMILASQATSGLIYVPENLGQPTSAAQQAAQDYEAQTPGAAIDPATGQKIVPALVYQNRNPNGLPYVKWDGSQVLPDGTTELIDSKTRIVPYSTSDGPAITENVQTSLLNKSAALTQNPSYTGVIDLPTQSAVDEAKQVLNRLGIENISAQLRPAK